jgi:hypothetical protein
MKAINEEFDASEAASEAEHARLMKLSGDIPDFSRRPSDESDKSDGDDDDRAEMLALLQGSIAALEKDEDRAQSEEEHSQKEANDASDSDSMSLELARAFRRFSASSAPVL